MNYKIKRLENLPDNFKPRYCKKTTAGNITEFVELTHKPKDIDCKRVSKDFYIVPSEETGEVYEYKHAGDKSDSVQSVRRSLVQIRLLINANCVEANKLHWVTLTYAENMTDRERLYKDFDKFWKRFCYYFKQKGFEKPKYISVVEPQGRGAWHIHCIFIWSDKAPFIDNNSVLAPMWGHGFTKIKAVKTDCDNLGAYFSAYLADMPIEEYEQLYGKKLADNAGEVKNVLSEDGKETPKRIIKGGRLHLYPSGMQIYRTSRDIIRPVAEVLTPSQAKKEKANAGTLTFSSAFAVVGVDENNSDDNDSKNNQIISKEYYNTKRKKSQ